MGSTGNDGLEATTVEHGKAEHTTLHEAKETDNGGLATLDAGYDESDVIADLPPAEGKKALRKVDMRLVPLLAVSTDHLARRKLS